MTTRFWLVRHGPTHAKAAIGWTDLAADLSDTDQLARLSEALPEDAVIVSSDLRRTVATADAIAQGRTRLPHIRDLREIHFGTWENRSFDEIAAEDPDRARAYWDSPGDISPPGGESWNDLSARVTRSLFTLSDQFVGRDVICVVHFGVILAALQNARALTAASVLGFRIDPLSLTQLTYLRPSGSWQIGCVNQGY